MYNEKDAEVDYHFVNARKPPKNTNNLFMKNCIELLVENKE